MKSSPAYLITGGCGFIGTSLIAHLIGLRPDSCIRILDNLSVGTKDDLAEASKPRAIVEFANSSSVGGPGSVELFVGDIRDPDVCMQACKDIDFVVHLAANTGVAPSVADPRADFEANVTGTFNMLEAARLRNIRKFIFASSGAPLGEVEPPVHEEKAPRPMSPYGAGKLAGEGYCSAYYRTFGLKTISLRFGNVYGPRSKRKSSVVAKFFQQALAGEPLEIFGDGSQTRDFIYIDDLIQAIMLAIDPRPADPSGRAAAALLEPWGEVFQIATHRETTINEIAENICRLTEHVRHSAAKVVYAVTRRGDMKRNYADITKAKTMLGFCPRHDLESGLRNTLAYFLRENR